jgi:hypothetical protein
MALNESEMHFAVSAHVCAGCGWQEILHKGCPSLDGLSPNGKAKQTEPAASKPVAKGRVWIRGDDGVLVLH